MTTSEEGGAVRTAPEKARSSFDRLRTTARRTLRDLERRSKNHPTLVFVASLLLLDCVVNLRYPDKEPPLWFIVPSLDVIALLLFLVAIGRLKWKLPPAARMALVGWLVLVRLLRLGDGIQQHYFSEQLNLYSDLVLFPELIRFVHSALPLGLFILSMLGAVISLVAVALGLYFGLSQMERYLRKRRQTYIAAAVVAGLGGLSALVGHKPSYNEYFSGPFAASIVPRLKHEADFLYGIYSGNSEHARVMAQAEQRLRGVPTNLAKLKGKNVYLILVESYGDCVFSSERLAEPSRPVFAAFRDQLGANGFSIVSGVLDSPTYGGRSWVAHATLATGIRVTNQLEYDLVTTRKPPALARFFRNAGYATVLVQPGTTRPWPKGKYLDFETTFYLWNLDYAGPKYAWSTMPDQYVLDFIQRRELRAPSSRPRFIQYVLVTSHAPWSDLPPVVDDWDSIGNGSIYHRLKTQHFPVRWPDFANAQEPYIRSIIYDFEVLRRYILRAIGDDSLVIILGDHQPVTEVAGDSESWGVPVHVLSRDKEALKPFEARGYVPGMHPPLSGARAGLETFLGDFLADFSTWDGQGNANPN